MLIVVRSVRDVCCASEVEESTLRQHDLWLKSGLDTANRSMSTCIAEAGVDDTYGEASETGFLVIVVHVDGGV